MMIVDSSVRDAKWALREYDDETLLGTWDKEIRHGYGKRIYIPRALNDRDVNEAILRMYFVRRWKVGKRWLLVEPIDIAPSCSHDF